MHWNMMIGICDARVPRRRDIDDRHVALDFHVASSLMPPAAAAYYLHHFDDVGNSCCAVPPPRIKCGYIRPAKHQNAGGRAFQATSIDEIAIDR